jgi:hypothetical protein
VIADKAINTHEKVRNIQNRLYLTAKADRLRLNAEGRRISESRMRENRTYGLMRGRWQPHCSTLSKV